MRTFILTDQDRNSFIERIKNISLDGKKKWIAEFKPFRIQRSLRQNSLYWMWLRCISAETGNDSDALDEYFKNKHLPRRFKTVLGEEVQERPSTSKLDSGAFTVYLNAIKTQMVQDYGILLPEPGEREFEAFYTQYGII